ncbi:MAG TPA: universal stress protein [Candidatus Sulfotelmatobacter sp.]|nr:universal stress protein [Candidatus Sulfotelmatobacter sp.]
MALAEPKIHDSSSRICLFRNILVAADFSHASTSALSAAIALAAENDAHLSVIHVLQSDWRYEMLESPPELDLERLDADRRLKKLIADLKPERQIDSKVLKNGPIAGAILSLATESGIDLLVVGTHGRRGLSKFALGSVSEELLRRAPCPVLTVGPHAHSPQCFHTILFATDFGQGSTKALPCVLALTKASQGRLIMLHMIPPVPASSANLTAYAPATVAADEVEQWNGSLRNRAVQQLKEYLPADHGLQTEPEYVVGTDYLQEGILTAADKFNANLIVMGANRATAARLAAHVPWTTVHEVLIHAPCPVLTFAG